ncbi:hypothetical protein EKO04_006335 [Ascochyta lentis]|uniref:Uncharacterized protein n=1 Tax=Ascochyta lentis TaxID=205686 RepID=A0A8H7MHU0_9PLEO|nr:hypothetical protein EKO04_006335 [Ascochyta lentis]
MPAGTATSSFSDYASTASAPVRKPLQHNDAGSSSLVQNTNPNIRKLLGAKTDNTIITEGRNIKKALARKKKAHHVPLLAGTLKMKKKNEGIRAAHISTTPIAPMQDENKSPSDSTTYHIVSEFPSEYFQLPELTISKSSAGSSLESLNGFNPDFSFDGHQAFASAAVPLNVPPPSASTFVAKGVPLSTLDTIKELQPNIALKTTTGFLSNARDSSKFPVSDLVELTTTKTPMVTTVKHYAVVDTKNIAARQRHQSDDTRSSPSKDAEFPALTYPDIYVAALGRSSDILTPKIVAWARETALAAYNEEAQHDHAAAIANLEGLHLSYNELETSFAVDLDGVNLKAAAPSITLIDDGEVLFPVNGSPNTPASEPSEVSSSYAEYGDIYRWNQPSEHRVFISGQNGHCRVVSATERLYDVKITYEDSDCESVLSSDDHLELPSDDSDSTIPLLSEDHGPGDEGVTSSDSAESIINTPHETVSSHYAPAAFEDGASMFDLDELTASSVESVHGQKWLVLTAPPTPSLPSSTTKPAAVSGAHDWLVLTPSFTALRSEMTNTSLDAQSASSTPESAPTKHEGAPPSDDDRSDFDPAEALQAEDTPTEFLESPAPIASPDWTSDLVHTMLGTESLFTFLSILDVSDNGLTTKPALVTAFLDLVAAERTKLDLPTLPTSCTPSTFMRSKILPHTTLLGATSLATFLAQFDFSTGDVVEAEQVYKTFKDLCKEEIRKNMLATTGKMGALGRRLGKLSSF